MATLISTPAGPFILALSAITAAIVGVTIAAGNAREKSQEAARAATEQLSALDGLKAKYEDIISSAQDEATKTQELNDWKRTLIDSYNFEKEAIEGVNLERERSLELLDAEIQKARRKAVNEGLATAGADRIAEVRQAIESPTPYAVRVDNINGAQGGIGLHNGGVAEDQRVSQETIDRMKEYGVAVAESTTAVGKYVYTLTPLNQGLEDQKDALAASKVMLEGLENPTEGETLLLNELGAQFDRTASSFKNNVDEYQKYIALLAEDIVLGAGGQLAGVDTADEYAALEAELIKGADGVTYFENAIKSALASALPQFAQALDDIASGADQATSFVDTLAYTSSAVDTLNRALAEQAATGNISAETYKALFDAGEEYQKLVSITSDGLVLLSDKATEYANSLVSQAIQQGVVNGYTREQIQQLAELYIRTADLNAQLDDMQAGYQTAADALAEYNESGMVSISTFQSLLELSPEYLAALDLENGKLIVNEEALRAVTEALKEEAVTKLQNAAASDIKALADGRVDEMSTLAKGAVESLGDKAATAGIQMEQAAGGVLTFAESVAALLATQGVDTSKIKDEMKAITDAYGGIADDIGKIKIDFGSVGKSSSSKKSGAGSKKEKDENLEAYKAAVKEIQYLRDMDIVDDAEYYNRLKALADKHLSDRSKYLDEYRKVEVEIHNWRKKMLEDERKAAIKVEQDAYKIRKENAEKQYRAEKDAAEDQYKARKKAAEDQYKQQRKLLEDQKKLLDEELDAYKSLIDAKKDLLRQESDAHDHDRDVAERNKRIADLEADIADLAGDDSEKAKAQRVTLQAELSDEINELQELQYDRSISLQEDALDKEYERYKSNLDGQIKLLDDQLDKLKDRYDLMMDDMEASNDRYIDGLELSHDALMNGLEVSSNAFIRSIELKYDALINGAYQAANEISRAFASVADMQNHLMSSGFDLPRFGADGIVGPETVSALQRYLNQLGESLVVDGILGSKTSAAMRRHNISFPTYHKGGKIGEGVSAEEIRKNQETYGLKPNELVVKAELGETVIPKDKQANPDIIPIPTDEISFANMKDSLSRMEQIMFDPKMAASLQEHLKLGFMPSLYEQLSQKNAAFDRAMQMINNNTNHTPVTIQMTNHFTGVDAANVEKITDRIVAKAETAVFRKMNTMTQMGHGFPPSQKY